LEIKQNGTPTADQSVDLPSLPNAFDLFRASDLPVESGAPGFGVNLLNLLDVVKEAQAEVAAHLGPSASVEDLNNLEKFTRLLRKTLEPYGLSEEDLEAARQALDAVEVQSACWRLP